MRMRNKPWAKPVLESCAYYYDGPERPAGDWQSCFGSRQPLHLELGCGKGVFIAQLAARHPEINYLAIDMKSMVLASAVKNIEQIFAAQEIPVCNVALTAYDIERILNLLTVDDHVERIYINFCNPWPKLRHQKKRLVHSRMLKRYQTFLVPGGEIHFKTDDSNMFADAFGYFSEAGFEILYRTEDLYQSGYQDNIDTEHERRFVAEGIPIKFLIARNPETTTPCCL